LIPQFQKIFSCKFYFRLTQTGLSQKINEKIEFYNRRVYW
jgi:hypothetical protein